ncbi:MAG TPA: hypothetical protein VGN20_15270 [Mucilaginibacter sp.]|jgi:transposase-like protein
MSSNKPCDIRAEVKLRNGYPNWWCHAHFASARGEGGKKLPRCVKADQPPTLAEDKIHIDITNYPGGVGIWGSLQAVYDTKRDISEKGVHVHLRRAAGGEKEIDRTFKEVYVKLPNELFKDDHWVMIDEYTACAYTASVLFNKNIKVIRCKHCGREHIDADWFAVHYHKKHLCTYCGRDFIDTERGISNPVISLQQALFDQLKDRKLTNVERSLNINQVDYPGGIQLWASNPAIIWTASRPEEAGIHVHLFKEKNGMPDKDDTYGEVIIDGIKLDVVMVRTYMVQRSFSFLDKLIVSLTCPSCMKEHFDDGDLAFQPHKDHECEHCGTHFEDGTRFKGVVSNPIVSRLQRLETIRTSLNYD